MGDLGSLVAGWLAQTTSLHVMLLGRSVHAHSDAQSAWLPYSDSPACITAVQCDIGVKSDVGILSPMIAAIGPLRTIMHAGGALRDATIGKQSVNHIRTAFAGKLQVCSLQAYLPSDFTPPHLMSYIRTLPSER